MHKISTHVLKHMHECNMHWFLGMSDAGANDIDIIMSISMYIKHTWGVTEALGVMEANCNSEAQKHQNPVYLWDVYLTMHRWRSMDNFDPGETLKSRALFNDGEGARDHCLAANNRR